MKALIISFFFSYSFFFSFNLSAQPCNGCLDEINALFDKRDSVGIKALLKHYDKECPASVPCYGRAHGRLSVIHYLNGDYRAAIYRGKQSYEWYKKAVPVDAAILEGSLTNLALFCEAIGDWKQAEQFYLLAIDCSKGKSTLPQQTLANLKGKLGDYDAAYFHYKLATDNSYLLGDQARIGDALMGFGKLLVQMGRVEEAIDTLNKGILVMKTVDDSESSLAGCHNNLGIAWAGLGKYEQAITHYQTALRLEKDPVEKAAFLNNMAPAHRRLKQYKQARRCLQEASNMAKANNMQDITSKCEDNLADVFLDEKNFEQALRHYQQAIKITMPEFQESSFLSLPTVEMLAKTPAVKEDLLIYLGDKAKGWLAWYNSTGDKTYLRHALETFRLADAVVTFMRREQSMRDSKLFWREKTKPMYEAALEAAFLMGDATVAFYFFEKSKSILLLDALSSLNARQAMPKDLEQKLGSLQAALVSAKETSRNAPGDQRAMQAFLEKQRALDQFLLSLKSSHPEIYSMMFEDKVMGLEETRQQYLTGNTTLIHYFLGQKSLYALAVPSQGKPVFHKAPLGKFMPALQKVLEMAASPKGLAMRNGAYQLDSLPHVLYREIFSPLVISEAATVLLIPDMELSLLPFEAFATQPPQPGKMVSLNNYLLTRHLFRHAFSATVLDMQHRFNRRGKNLFAMAPEFKNHPELALLANSEGACNLPYQGTKILRSSDATKAEFLKRAADYDLIFLYTHASSKGPWIAFADGYLYLSELDYAKFPADLIVLAACESGYGELVGGEGVMSLGTGFAYAGASSLASSLWSVNEFSTAGIFTRFFDNLSKGQSKAQALQNAKLAFLHDPAISDEFKNPYYWSAFVFYGNDGTTDLKPLTFLDKYGYYFATAFYVLAGLMGLLIFRRRKRGELGN